MSCRINAPLRLRTSRSPLTRTRVANESSDVNPKDSEAETGTSMSASGGSKNKNADPKVVLKGVNNTTRLWQTSPD